MGQYYAITKDEKELKHFGILGMHWGSRKAETSSGPSDNSMKARKLSNIERKVLGSKSAQKAGNKMLKKNAERDAKNKKNKQIRAENIKKNYDSHTQTQHVLVGIGGIVASNLVGTALISRGQVSTGVMLAKFGTAASIGMTAGNMLNQREYDVKYKK